LAVLKENNRMNEVLNRTLQVFCFLDKDLS
jgi:hypothetical protein